MPKGTQAQGESGYAAPGIEPAEIAQFVREELTDYGLEVRVQPGQRVAILTGEISALSLEPADLRDKGVFTPSNMILSDAHFRRLDKDALAEARGEAERLAAYARTAKGKAEGVEIPYPLEIGGGWFILESIEHDSTCQFILPTVATPAKLQNSLSDVVRAQPRRQRMLFRVVMQSYFAGIVDLGSGRAFVIESPLSETDHRCKARGVLFEPDWNEGHRLMTEAIVEARRVAIEELQTAERL